MQPVLLFSRPKTLSSLLMRLPALDSVVYSELSSTSLCFFFFFLLLLLVSLVCGEVGKVRKPSIKESHFRRNSSTPEAVQTPHGDP